MLRPSLNPSLVARKDVNITRHLEYQRWHEEWREAIRQIEVSVSISWDCFAPPSTPLLAARKDEDFLFGDYLATPSNSFSSALKDVN